MNKLLVSIIPGFYLAGFMILGLSHTYLGFGSLVIASIGLIAGFSGLFLWILGMATLGKYLSVMQQDNILITHGIYRFVKHPMYIGIFTCFLGFSIAKGSWFGILYSIFLIAPLSIARAKQEEQELTAMYGEKYTEYIKHTL